MKQTERMDDGQANKKYEIETMLKVRQSTQTHTQRRRIGVKYVYKTVT